MVRAWFSFSICERCGTGRLMFQAAFLEGMTFVCCASLSLVAIAAMRRTLGLDLGEVVKSVTLNWYAVAFCLD